LKSDLLLGREVLMLLEVVEDFVLRLPALEDPLLELLLVVDRYLRDRVTLDVQVDLLRRQIQQRSQRIRSRTGNATKQRKDERK
jgi:hypothetical protein